MNISTEFPYTLLIFSIHNSYSALVTSVLSFIYPDICPAEDRKITIKVTTSDSIQQQKKQLKSDLSRKAYHQYRVFDISKNYFQGCNDLEVLWHQADILKSVYRVPLLYVKFLHILLPQSDKCKTQNKMQMGRATSSCLCWRPRGFAGNLTFSVSYSCIKINLKRT